MIFIGQYADQLAPILALFQEIGPLDITLLIGFWLFWHASQTLQFRAAYQLVGIPAKAAPLFDVAIANYFVNLFLPSGNISTFALFAWHANRHGWQSSKTPFALILFALTQYASLSILILFGILILPQDTPLFTVGLSVGVMLILGTLFGCGVFWSFIYKESWFIGLWFLLERLPFRIAERLSNHPLSKHSLDVVSGVRRSVQEAPRREWVNLTVTSLLTRIAQCLILWGCGVAFDLTLPATGIVAASGVGVLFTIVSPIPMGVGIAESGIAITLSQFGVTLSQGTAIAILSRGFTLWLSVLIGGILLLRMGIWDFTATWWNGAQDPA